MDIVNPVFSSVASGLNTIIKVCEISLALKAVKEQTTSLLYTTQHVERNIIEAKRLMQQRATILSIDEKSWMERQIKDTEDALLAVAKLIEAARVSIQANGSTDMKTKAIWVFRDNLKAGEKMMRLSICAGTLNIVIGALYVKDAVSAPPEQKIAPQESEDDLRDRDDDGLPSYQMSQLLLNRKTSRMRLKSLGRLSTPSLATLNEDSVNQVEYESSQSIRLPTATVWEIEGRAVNATTTSALEITYDSTPTLSNKSVNSITTSQCLGTTEISPSISPSKLDNSDIELA